MVSFDDGPGPVSTPYILDQLRTIKNSSGGPLRAGFFLIGKDKSGTHLFDIWSATKRVHLPFTSGIRQGLYPDSGAEGNPELVRAIAREGHYALVHGAHHADLSRLNLKEVESEVLGCHESILKTGTNGPKFFRPPYLNSPSIPLDSVLAKEGWRMISGIPSGDGNPFADEWSVTESCRKSIERASVHPALLIFHDFRGLPDYRLDFRKIIIDLIGSGYPLVDFDPEIVGESILGHQYLRKPERPIPRG
jgi:peptidoglycan/xylan/chitin deacetylase (PgdA/CDA1 family)